MSKEVEREKGSDAPGAVPTQSNMVTPSPLVTALQQAQTPGASEIVEAFGEVTVIVPREHIRDVCANFKTAPGLEFDFLSDICGVDRGPEEEPRFEVNYQLFSTRKYHRLRLKVLLNETDPHVPTVTSV